MNTSKLLNIKIIRYEYLQDRTFGKLFINDNYLCHTLEDAVMPKNVKIAHKTAIESGIYEIQLTLSSKFKRKMPLIVNVPNFSGIRIHGGNSPDDSSGCILVAYNRYENLIQGTAEKELVSLIENFQAELVLLEIINLNYF